MPCRRLSYLSEVWLLEMELAAMRWGVNPQLGHAGYASVPPLLDNNERKDSAALRATRRGEPVESSIAARWL